MRNELFFSSKFDEWETPPEFFAALDALYHFDLDVAASEKNAKCEYFFDREVDGLKQSWRGRRCWLQPPYGRGTELWTAKAVQETRAAATVVVALLPARTDTQWFHRHVLPYAHVGYVEGRLTFVGAAAPAPFPSIVVTWPAAEARVRT